MFGKSLFVAPVLYRIKKHSRINYQLPKGLWYAWKTGLTNIGGPVSENVKLATLPLWVKGGSIIPLLASDINSTAMYNQTDVELQIYPDSAGRAEGELYEDDGVSNDYKKGFYRCFLYTQRGNKADFSIQKSEGAFKPRRKYFIVLPEGIQSLRFKGKTYRPVERRVALKL